MRSYLELTFSRSNTLVTIPYKKICSVACVNNVVHVRTDDGNDWERGFKNEQDAHALYLTIKRELNDYYSGGAVYD